ncbi:hypothetical protein [Kyrpidia spormannii]|uniref:Uncharacterized protein n=2 Tax=Kyrpidia spormannii TaxID=2055160 RepID=A0ACA8ZAV3_9BACL|nr:hypothetical protein [Kyrpidia spormannii]CAB3393355.1 conserved exported protein of unknown function [Kyrpidia spormannii]CAB3394276.1 conserved exported protein of unknown function [Kyrpidia spormannii]
MRKWMLSLGLSAALSLGSVVPALAADSTPAPAPASGLGNLLGAVGSLLGSSNVDAQSAVCVQVGDAVVTAKAVNSVNQPGLTGLVSGGILGGTAGTAASASYAGYSASTSASGSWGLASSTQALGNLLSGLGSALGGGR